MEKGKLSFVNLPNQSIPERAESMPQQQQQRPKRGQTKRSKQESQAQAPSTLITISRPAKNPLDIPELLQMILSSPGVLATHELLACRRVCTAWNASIISICATATELHLYSRDHHCGGQAKLSSFPKVILMMPSFAGISVKVIRAMAYSLPPLFPNIERVVFGQHLHFRIITELTRILSCSGMDRLTCYEMEYGQGRQVPTLAMRTCNQPYGDFMASLSALSRRLTRLQVNMACALRGPSEDPHMVTNRLHHLDYTFHWLADEPRSRSAFINGYNQRVKDWHWEWKPKLGADIRRLWLRSPNQAWLTPTRLEEIFNYNSEVLSGLTHLGLVGRTSESRGLRVEVIILEHILTLIERFCPNLQHLELALDQVFLLNSTTWRRLAGLDQLTHLTISSEALDWQYHRSDSALHGPAMASVEWLHLNWHGHYCLHRRPRLSPFADEEGDEDNNDNSNENNLLAQVMLRMWPNVRTFNQRPGVGLQQLLGPYTESDCQYRLEWDKVEDCLAEDIVA